MNNNNFLIPANSKKSQLILGFFNGFDLMVFLFGVGFSVLLLCLVKSNNLMVMLGLASPAIIASFLVAPVPNYHNVMTLIGNIYKYSTGRKKYYWRGWCVKYGNNRGK
ncbi:MAG: hypothetical protein ACI4XM_02590 [Candidatus Coprovivens sp.]